MASLVLPLTLVALSGRLRWSAAASAIAAAAIVIEAYFSGGPDGGSGFRFAAALVLISTTLSWLVATVVRVLRRSLEDPNMSLHSEREHEWASPGLRGDAVAAETPIPQPGFPVLLETLEEIGRRISMNLDLDTIVPAIVSTAKASIDCEECRVYLLENSGRNLVNPLSQGTSEDLGFVPSVNDGIGARVIRERAILTSEQVKRDPILSAELGEWANIPDAVAPLTAGGDLLGLLVIDKLKQPASDIKHLLYTLTNLYALGIKNAQLFRRVEEMALRDGLTGLFNHTTFQRELRNLVRKSIVDGTHVSLVMSDVDLFKSFNDDYGHQAGDDVLRELAQLWKAVMPDSAILARYGGEEFIAAVPNADEDRATELAEILRSAIEQHPFLSHGREMRVTASFGVAEFAGGTQSTDDLVRIADQCLYSSKKSGRNRVVSHSSRSVIAIRNTN